MEIIFELLYELILEGAAEIIQDKEFPRGVRIGAGAILFVGFGGILAILIYAAWDSWSDGSIAGAIILAVLALALLVLIISVFIKPPKKRK